MQPTLRQILVGIEIALGTALVASAALLLHSFLMVMDASRGYEETEHGLAVDLHITGPAAPPGFARVRFFKELAWRRWTANRMGVKGSFWLRIRTQA